MIIKKITVLAFFLCLILLDKAFADTLKDEKEIRVFTDSLMEKVVANDIGGVINSIKKYSPISPTELDAGAIQTKAQREQFGQRYGAAISYEFIRKENVGGSLIMMQYIEKTNKHALPWTFYFYKIKDGWIINTFNWNDDYRVLFQ